MAESTPGPIPDGTIVLHIGPHKTGTTTLQKAFHQNRPALAEQRIHYAGSKSQPMQAAMAAASGAKLATAGGDVGTQAWERLLEAVHGSPARIRVVSSEFFADARDSRIPVIIDELGRAQTRVVITLRPLVRIVPSQWQQYMQNRAAMNYDDDLDYEGWLEQMLADEPPRGVTPSFWRRHRHDRLVERWVAAVGADRVTVIVVDDSDRRMLLDTFEELLALVPGTLEPREESFNRSLTVPEISLVRAFNKEFVDRGWDVADYTSYLRFGAVRHLLARRAAPDAARLATPEWAVERICALAAEMTERIRATGVTVIGDPRLLADPTLAGPVGENAWTDEVPAETVARLMVGFLQVALDTQPGPAAEGRKPGRIEQGVRTQRMAEEIRRLREKIAAVTTEGARSPRLADASRLQVARALAGRVRRRLRQRLRR